MIASTILTQTKHELYRQGGYSPSQWVLGSRGPRIPGSLLQPEEAQRLEVHAAAADPQSAMARSLAIREAARVAYCRLDNDCRVRRAMLLRTRPHDGPCPFGSAVYYRRAQVRRGETPLHRWFGIARVVGHEGRGSGIWLRHGPSLVSASPQQIRFAMEEELLASRLLGEDMKIGTRQSRLYTDVRQEDPLVEPGPQASVPERPEQAASGGAAPAQPQDGGTDPNPVPAAAPLPPAVEPADVPVDPEDLDELMIPDGSHVQEATRLASEGVGPSMAGGSEPALAQQRWSLNESLKDLDRLDG